jgi:hypothetical protein
MWEPARKWVEHNSGDHMLSTSPIVLHEDWLSRNLVFLSGLWYIGLLIAVLNPRPKPTWGLKFTKWHWRNFISKYSIFLCFLYDKINDPHFRRHELESNRSMWGRITIGICSNPLMQAMFQDTTLRIYNSLKHLNVWLSRWYSGYSTDCKKSSPFPRVVEVFFSPSNPERLWFPFSLLHDQHRKLFAWEWGGLEINFIFCIG